MSAFVQLTGAKENLKVLESDRSVRARICHLTTLICVLV
jgi:hypothetical protein